MTTPVEELWRDRGYEIRDRHDEQVTIDIFAGHEDYGLRYFAHQESGLVSLGGTTPCVNPSDISQRPGTHVELGTPGADSPVEPRAWLSVRESRRESTSSALPGRISCPREPGIRPDRGTGAAPRGLLPTGRRSARVPGR